MGQRDGRWLAVGAIEAKFFANLCRALGCPELAGSQYEDEAQPAIRDAFAAAFASRTRDEWVEVLAGADTCVAPVLEVGEVVSHTRSAAPDLVVTVTHPKQGEFAQLGPLLAGMDPKVPPTVPDMSDTDTERLLKEAGVDAETVMRWLHAGVVG